METPVKGKPYSDKSVIEQCKQIHGDKYIYDDIQYIGASFPFNVTCKTHGVFSIRKYDHIQRKRGCPKCTKQYCIDLSLPAILYYIKITHNKTIFYKIGITSRKIEERFKKWELDKIEILSVEPFKTGKQAKIKEQLILNKFKDHLYKGSEKILSRGNTELFTIDVL